jgi:hypothetical protein
MSYVPMPDLPDEDEAYNRARQKLVDMEFDLDRDRDPLDPARGIVFGILAALALWGWLIFAVWRWAL